MKKKTALIILLAGLALVTADALVTNFMISRTLPELRQGFELNPLMAGIAGTPWLLIAKAGWVISMIMAVLFVNDRKFGRRKHDTSY